MKKEHLSIFVALANIDDFPSREELNFIRKIGLSAGFSVSEIEEVIAHPIEIDLKDSLSKLDQDEKFEFLYNIIRLMKIDGKLYKKEIDFCLKVASFLGFSGLVLFEFIDMIISDSSIHPNKESIRSVVEKHYAVK